MNDADRFRAVVLNIVGRRPMYKDLIAAVDSVTSA
jgi:hypothetical protein